MENETKIMHKARKLAGKQVEITRRKKPQAWLPGMEFGTDTVKGTITEVSDWCIKMKVSCGTEKNLFIKDDYFTMESVREV